MYRLFIPEGYEVVETDQVVASDTTFAYTHLFKFLAERHAEKLNEDRIGPLYRYEVERTSSAMQQAFGWAHRWACVPYQNVLRKKQ